MPSGISVVDVNGSFKRFLKQAPKIIRQELHDTSIEPTAANLAARMRANAPYDPDTPPHMRDAIGFTVRGLVGQAGILDSDQAEVALYNEYSPNHQPFMMPASEAETHPFVQRSTKALKNSEGKLTI